jgi:hypothetical protein
LIDAQVTTAAIGLGPSALTEEQAIAIGSAIASSVHQADGVGPTH